ncbi:DUF3379 family protein [Echinimonas agarilytica]|uniref:DUF3379 domain-containing protein n=1 Tax=Echinimonas agarilytica TaxID=1215918 RepID=A0AA41W5C2_9GAMM|nr:DUF3379 family protein [Echinimonas agarilytica]MCM2679216.1 DUF3379 domain-containing protein [Echinimonas agarilytica]
MDDLEFRKRLIADPYDNDAAMKEAIQTSRERQSQVAEMKAFDDKIAAALAVDVPEGLADELLFKQRFDQHKEQHQTRKWIFAMAASITLVVTATFALWPQPHSELANYALAHVYHEPAVLSDVNEHATLSQVNAKLAGYGAHLTEAVAPVYYANHCDFKGKRSLHLVMGVNDERVTVFVVPNVNDFKEVSKHFSDGQFKGQVFVHGTTGLVVIGKSEQHIQKLEQTLEENINWGPI